MPRNWAWMLTELRILHSWLAASSSCTGSMKIVHTRAWPKKLEALAHALEDSSRRQY